MSFATAPDGARLYYETLGKGEPLLLIMGQGNDHQGWDVVRDDFARRYQVIVYDHRGTGQSDKPEDKPYSTRGFAGDAVAILDHLAIARSHIYGISMGGRVAQWLAIDYPQRVAAVVIGCSSPGKTHGIPRPRETMEILQKGDQAAILAMMYSPEWSAANPELANRLMFKPRQNSSREMLKMHFVATEAHDAGDHLGSIKAPTLVIHGDADMVNVTANAPILARLIPGAELRLIAGGRHIFVGEFREEAAAAVLNFLSRHPISA